MFSAPGLVSSIKYFVFSILFLILIPKAVFAQASNQTIPYQSPNTATAAIYSFAHAVSCIIIGNSPISPCLEYKFTKNIQGAISATPYLSSVNTSGGLLGMGGSMIEMLYQQPPLDHMSFIRYVGVNFGVIKEVNAQVPGSGNQVLSPIFALWTVSRNVAYMLMILVFVAVGLMVMFRQKLNPQTIVSIQMALPGLIIGLVLITFSYFLASLITDMAYVGTDLVGYYFDAAIDASGGATTEAGQPLTQRLADQSALSIGGKAMDLLDEPTLKGVLDQMWNNLPPDRIVDKVPGIDSVFAFYDLKNIIRPRGVVSLFAAGLTYITYNTVLGPIADVAGGISSIAGGLSKFMGNTRLGNGLSLAGVIIGATGTSVSAGWGLWAYNYPTDALAYFATIVAVIILLYAVVQLFLKLINCYLSIIFLTISSPFIFLASSIPGRQGMAITWMRNMLANVLAFPAVIAVFYFAAFLIGDSLIPGFGVSKPLNINTATGNLPFLGGINLEFLRRILAFVAILATPSIPDIINQTIGQPSKAGSVLAGAVGGAIAGGQKYQGQIQGQVQRAGSDMGTWRESLVGKKPVVGGRLGSFQSKFHPMANNGEDPYDPLNTNQLIGESKDTSWRGTLARGASTLRRQMSGIAPQDPAAQSLLETPNQVLSPREKAGRNIRGPN